MIKTVVIGAGPAGLTAAYELLSRSSNSEVIVLEETDEFGGISKTVNYKGNRMDTGGHRFFSKVPEVNEWWRKMLPGQGSPSKDDRILGRKSRLDHSGPDPDQTDNVMLYRHRVCRILFDSKFYDYPITLKPETFTNMGLKQTMLAGLSYFHALLFKLPEDNLENFYINRFGRKLYSMFFEYYTENLWGRHPKDIDASWGSQRVKGLSVISLFKNDFGRLFFKKKRKMGTSLTEEFMYPKYGPGQLWEITADKIEELGGKIITKAKVIGIKTDNSKVKSVTYIRDGNEFTVDADNVISSMPLKDLIAGMNDVPLEISDIAKGLPYRDYMTLGVLVSKLSLKNKTNIRTIGNIIPDCWIYVQDRNVRLGRFQIYNNWSPYLVNDPENTVWIGLEYFVNEGSDFWNMTEIEFSQFGVSEMIKLGIIDSENVILDTHMVKIKKAYPAYFDTYKDIGRIKEYLNGLGNLYCVGRNGQHRYNNMDHSMVTSFKAVDCILTGKNDKESIWNVNTEQEYH